MTRKLRLTSLFFAISVMILYPACSGAVGKYNWAVASPESSIPPGGAPISYEGTDGVPYETMYWIIEESDNICSVIPVDPMGPPNHKQEYNNDDGSVQYGVRGWPNIQPNENNSVYKVDCDDLSKSSKPYGNVVNTWDSFTLEVRCNALDSCP